MSGYKVVPVEPTRGILDEFDSIIDCGAEDSKDAWHRLLAAAPAVQGGPVGWQFYDHGEWRNGEDRIKDHRKNTEEAGFLVRDVYATAQPAPSATTFRLGDHVRKTKGSQWKGRVVGTYSTTLTPEGYAVESDTEKGSVQIYPVGALELVVEDVQKPTADAAGLVEALEAITSWVSHPAATIARKALAAHRKGAQP